MHTQKRNMVSSVLTLLSAIALSSLGSVRPFASTRRIITSHWLCSHRELGDSVNSENSFSPQSPPILPFDSPFGSPWSDDLSPIQCEEDLYSSSAAEEEKVLSVTPFCDQDITLDLDERVLLSASSKNHFKNKPIIPAENVLFTKESKRTESSDDLPLTLRTDIFEAILARDHASVLSIVDSDCRQLERGDFTQFDIPGNSSPLLVAISLGLPAQLIKVLLEKTPQRSLAKINLGGASALSTAIMKRMPREILAELIKRTPSDLFGPRGDYDDNILCIAVLSKLEAALLVPLIERTTPSDIGKALALAVESRLSLPLLQLLIARAPIESIRVTVRAALYKRSVPPEYLCLLVEADLPLKARAAEEGYSSWHMLLSHPGDGNLDAVALLLLRNRDAVGELALSEDADGRISFGMASKRVREEMSKYL